ncbi:hypothetical protein CEP53_005109 [Fusarium sp. AF-6]|nr:hypothetical protein CEP53_005109 [Fusarium sp. AF-6]
MAEPDFQLTEDQVVELDYIQNSDLFQRQKPYEIVSEVWTGATFTSSQETHFNLDDNGFQVVQHPLQTTVFDKETITTEYRRSWLRA